MAMLLDIGVSVVFACECVQRQQVAINIVCSLAFLLASALLQLQPFNDRVYFPKWYIKGERSSPRGSDNFVGRFVNLNVRTYFTFLNWMSQALKMSKYEIVRHAGLDSAVFLRIYILGLKIFIPITIVAQLILFPVNMSNGMLYFLRKDLVMSNIVKLSISNVPPRCISVTFMENIGRLLTLMDDVFLHIECNSPRVGGRSLFNSVDHFFKTNHPDHYLGYQAVYDADKFAKLAKKRNRPQNWLDNNQLKYERHGDQRPTPKEGFCGLWGRRVDSIECYKQQIKDLDKKIDDYFQLTMG